MHTVRCFKRDLRGSTGVIFSLALLPVLGFAGAAVDYSRASAERAVLQKAADGAALALVREADTLSDTQLQARGQTFFNNVLGRDPLLSLKPVKVTRTGTSIRVVAAGSVSTNVMRVMGFNEIPIDAEAVAAWGRKKIELALVLDNTGSMSAKNKLNELKRASYDLIDTLEAAARTSGEADSIRISIVPFNTKVNVGEGRKDAPWLTYRERDPNPALRMTRREWTGCITDREEIQDLDTRDDGQIEGDPSTLHLATVCGEYFNGRLDRQGLAELRPLTSDFDALRRTVRSMAADGCTNITIGAAWGLDTLSDRGPLTGAAAYGNPDVEKIMVLLTDGNNTRSRAYQNASHCSEGTFVGTQIDQRTRKACETIKAERYGQHIRLYTIRVIDGNANLLSDCASKGNDGKPLYYDVQDASALQGVFKEIVNGILATRLTH